MATQQRQGFQPPPKRRRGVGLMILGAVFALMSLGSLLIGINGLAYLMGAGTEIRVTVTETAMESEDGSGYYVEDGERVPVRLSYGEEGETLTARQLVIPIPAVGNPVIANSLDAEEDLRMLIGVLVLGVPALIFIRRGHGFYTGRTQPQRHRVTRPG